MEAKMLKLYLPMLLNFARMITPTDPGDPPMLQRTFKLQETPQFDTLSIISSWATTSVASCANSCMNLYPNDCQGFMFNANTGLCRLVVTSSAGASLISTKAEGDLYYSTCDASKGFQYVVNGSTKACLAIFGRGTYAAATAACVNMGAILMSVKTPEKLAILLRVAASKSVWVGCDDLSQKYTYRWLDDGSVLTNETISQLFVPGDPNYGAGEDCICLSGGRDKLADYTCAYQTYYACEMMH